MQARFSSTRLRAPAPAAAVVALSRRDGAAVFSVDEFPAFGTPEFQVSFRSLAQEHQVLGLVLVELERAGIDPLPGPLADDARNLLRFLRRQAALWDLERDFIAGRLNQRGILAVLLKGAALRLTTYGDSAERPVGDIDLLVRKEDLNEAAEILTAAGYQKDPEARAQLYLQHHHHLVFRKDPGFKIEVHWALQPARAPLLLDHDAFLRDALSAITPDAPVMMVPAAEHMVIHLSAQNLEDGFSRLRRLVDIDRVISGTVELDWNRLASETARMRAQGVVALSLRLCELMLGTAIPPGFLGRLRLSKLTRTHLAILDPVGRVIGAGGSAGSAARRLLTLWCIPQAATRLRFLREVATGEADWLGRQLASAGSIHSGWAREMLIAVKLLGLQCLLYAGAGIAWAKGSGRTRAFWHGV